MKAMFALKRRLQQPRGSTGCCGMQKVIMTTIGEKESIIGKNTKVAMNQPALLCPNWEWRMATLLFTTSRVRK